VKVTEELLAKVRSNEGESAEIFKFHHLPSSWSSSLSSAVDKSWIDPLHSLYGVGVVVIVGVAVGLVVAVFVVVITVGVGVGARAARSA